MKLYNMIMGIVLIVLGAVMIIQNHFAVSWSTGFVILVGLFCFIRAFRKTE